MKTLIKTFSFLALSLVLMISAVCFVFPEPAHAATDYVVAGYSETVDFTSASDANNFNVTGEHGDVPYVADGMLKLPNTGFMYCAQKNRSYSGDTEIIVKVVRLLDQQYPHINAAIIFASDSFGQNGWAINMTGDAGKNFVTFDVCTLKNNGLGGLSHVSVPVAKDFIVKMVIKSGVLNMFIDASSVPALTYRLGGNPTGGVGFRSYYSAVAIDYFTVTNSAISSKPSTYNVLLTNANAIDKSKLTTTSKNALTSAITALQNANNQYDLDFAGKNLEVVMSELVYKRTQTEMNNAIARAEAITNPNGAVYTANSYNALQKVLQYCKTLSSSDEHEFSLMVTRLENCIANLVSYIGG